MASQMFNREEHQSSVLEDNLHQGDVTYAMVRALNWVIEFLQQNFT